MNLYNSEKKKNRYLPVCEVSSSISSISVIFNLTDFSIASLLGSIKKKRKM
jgi:hypothetical protein